MSSPSKACPVWCAWQLVCFEISVRNVWPWGFWPESLSHFVAGETDLFWSLVNLSSCCNGKIVTCCYRWHAVQSKAGHQVNCRQIHWSTSCNINKSHHPTNSGIEMWLLDERLKKTWISGSWARESEGSCGELVLGNVYCLYCILLRKHDLWKGTSALDQVRPSPCLTAPVCLCNTTDVNEATPLQGSEGSARVISCQLFFDAFKTNFWSFPNKSSIIFINLLNIQNKWWTVQLVPVHS